MEFDWTMTFGNALTAVAILGSAASLIVLGIRWQTKTDARVAALEADKVSVSDCTQSHGEVVTRGFCKGQHDGANAAIEGLTEAFGNAANRLTMIQTNQGWLMKAVEGLSQGGVRLANPHPAPLPPKPPGYPGEDDEEVV